MKNDLSEKPGHINATETKNIEDIRPKQPLNVYPITRTMGKYREGLCTAQEGSE
jgi:hypothetical protein